MIRTAFFLLFLSSLFCCERWIVVTTIQYPTPQIRKLAQMPGWRMVVVGDRKTPADWHLDGCDYLSPAKQLELPYELSSLLPWNHYSRKNIGYLYAIQNGAKIIYETDDDNEPLEELRYCERKSPLTCLDSDDSCANIYGYFGLPAIWPRGFPLEKIVTGSKWEQKGTVSCLIGIEQGVVNQSPDVDAIFRLTQDQNVSFSGRLPAFLSPGTFCPFNSQNTFIHESAFFTLYLPSTVTMRVSDIWRGYLAQKLLWHQGEVLAFSGPNAIQDRNEHNLMADFAQELDLYLKAGKMVNSLNQIDLTGSQPIEELYEKLIGEGFFKTSEAELLGAWMRDLQRVQQ